jgi:DNA-binding MarR family transcriptional regulator
MSSGTLPTLLPLQARPSWIDMARKNDRSRPTTRRTASPAAERAQLQQSALIVARTLVDRMRTLYRELERTTGAPITMHRALTRIGEEPGIAASTLAQALGMQRPAVSHVLRGLAERGWIERRRYADDQRSVRLHLTRSGHQLLNATGGRAVGTLQRAVRQLSLQQLAGLAAGVEALLAHLPPEPAPRYVRRYTRSAAAARGK